MSVEEAAELIGIGRALAYREVRAKRLRAVRSGRKLLVPLGEPEAYLERLAGEGSRLPAP